MSRFGSVFKSAVVGIIAVGSAAGVVQAQNEVTQEITAGELSAFVSDATLTSVAFSNSDETNTGSLALTVTDERGTDDGWYVTVLAGDFTDGGTNTIPASGFSTTGYSNLTSVVGDPVAGLTPGTPGGLSTALQVLQAADAAGTGQYTMDMAVSLEIPAQTAVGTYVSTLTVTATGGQP